MTRPLSLFWRLGCEQTVSKNKEVYSAHDIRYVFFLASSAPETDRWGGENNKRKGPKA